MLLAALVAIAVLRFDVVVEEAIETFGPVLTGTSVELEDVELSVLDGRGAVRGLVIANPKGFDTKYAIRVRNASVHLVPRSVFQEKIVVRSIRIDSSNIHLETKKHTTNLEQLVKNIQRKLGGGSGNQSNGSFDSDTDDAKALWTKLTEQKVQIDHFVVSDAQIHASGGPIEGRELDVPPLDLEIHGLGTGDNGESVARVSMKVLRRISTKASAQVAERVLSLGIGGKGDSASSEDSADDDAEGAPENAKVESPTRERRRDRRQR